MTDRSQKRDVLEWRSKPWRKCWKRGRLAE